MVKRRVCTLALDNLFFRYSSTALSTHRIFRPCLFFCLLSKQFQSRQMISISKLYYSKYCCPIIKFLVKNYNVWTNASEKNNNIVFHNAIIVWILVYFVNIIITFRFTRLRLITFKTKCLML